MNQITVYTTSTCPYCTMMKSFLDAQSLPYKEVNVQQDPVAANRLVAATGQMGVPQTEINGQWVLGFDPDQVLRLVK
ncbi:glutaredoxin family protein [Bhargavaea beijingensis]|uniref:Glutaredoxin family protein n=1 Tax=Bhargavaea beijingensis TaxID=426756 RepID=A0A1G7H437_9BACL|nr:glutaredoxin family protein [Bhargavaea beijingensis]MCW1927376.1 glutaredoxin family protein [Bhargavaea beijingensis]RSK33731.1 glutaredoxin family protein [Bhargavaea beijingensis]SDE95073.1 Glutaredoxin-like protein, YruB-family [Bhargavaea beijingensis]